MPYQCSQCQSLFLKTLEIRIHRAGNALLYKKRCKRCKCKHLLQRTSLHGGLQPASLQDWQQGKKAPPSTGGQSPRLLVGEYTARISRASEPPLHYLNQIAQAQRQDLKR